MPNINKNDAVSLTERTEDTERNLVLQNRGGADSEKASVFPNADLFICRPLTDKQEVTSQRTLWPL